MLLSTTGNDRIHLCTDRVDTQIRGMRSGCLLNVGLEYRTTVKYVTEVCLLPLYSLATDRTTCTCTLEDNYEEGEKTGTSTRNVQKSMCLGNVSVLH